MPDANGIFTLVPTYKATPGQTIGVNQHNPVLEDIGSALNRRMMRDGSTAMTGPLPMGGNRVTNIAQGTASTDAARMDQVVPYTASMASFANLSVAVNEIAYGTGNGLWGKASLTPFARTLLDDADASQMRNTLGLTYWATRTSVVQVSEGGTGGFNAASARAGIGAPAAPTAGFVPVSGSGGFNVPAGGFWCYFFIASRAGAVVTHGAGISGGGAYVPVGAADINISGFAWKFEV